MDSSLTLTQLLLRPPLRKKKVITNAEDFCNGVQKVCTLHDKTEMTVLKLHWMKVGKELPKNLVVWIFCFILFRTSWGLACPIEPECDCFPKGCPPGISWYATCAVTMEQDVTFAYNFEKHQIDISCAEIQVDDLSQRLKCMGLLIWAISLQDCPLPQTNFSDYLEGISNLTKLSFIGTDQSIGSVHAELFRGFPGLQKFSLARIKLQEVPTDLLSAMQNLTEIDLSGNELVILPPELFNYTPNLVTINLASNHLQVLAEPLGNLPFLQILYLQSNKLVNLTRNAFSGLPSLEFLNLQGNHLNSLSCNIFMDLKNLKELLLFSNRLQQLPARLLWENAALQLLDLHDNPSLDLPEDFLVDHSDLRSVKLGECNLSSLPSRLFHGLTNLKELDLSFNLLRNLSAGMFSETPMLTNLSLHRNHLEELPYDIFRYQTRLIRLRLEHNLIAQLDNSVFSAAESLKELDISNNILTNIDNPFREHDGINLVSLRLNNNRLTSISYNAFISCTRLKYLDLSNNRLDSADFQLPQQLLDLNISRNFLREITVNMLQSLWNIKSLDLSHNRIEMISVTSLQFLPNQVVIDLQHNNISTIDLRLDSIEKVGETGVEKLLARLGYNPINCDCNLKLLLTHMKYQSQNRDIIYRLDVKHLICEDPPSLKGREIIRLTEEDLYCPVLENCPYPCECKQWSKGNVTVVRCPSNTITEIPAFAPVNTTVLDLTGNNITSLDNLTALAWRNLTTLILTDNNLDTLDVDILPVFLTTLRLDGNHLQRLSSQTLKVLSERTQLNLWLGRNPWLCDCDNAMEPWLESTANVMDSYNMTCANIPNTTVGRYVCPKPLNWIFIIVPVILVIIFAAIVSFLGIAYYKYLQEVRTWLYSRGWCLWIVSEKDVDADKQYDAFISFSQEDAKWVANQLLPGLEQQEPYYNICIHQRDWLVGEWIPDQIVRSVEESRRTIVVLSCSFLQSVWGRLEFKTAHYQALQDRMNRVIIIVLGEVPPKEAMDPEMRMYVGQNTYLKWEDPGFWKKLRYAMPHKPVGKVKSTSARMMHRLQSSSSSESSNCTSMSTLSSPSTSMSPLSSSSIIST